MAAHHTPLRNLVLDPGALDRIGLGDRHARMRDRQLPDLHPRLLGLVELRRSGPDLRLGQHGIIVP